MIVAALAHLPRQCNPTLAMQRAIAWLEANHANLDLPERIEIDGKNIYALVQVYETVAAEPEVRCEAHHLYLDIQYIASGEEMMGWVPLDGLRDVTPYNPEKDVLFGKTNLSELTPVQVRAGFAAVFYPEDAHAPKLAVSSPTGVRKIVVKVRCA